MVTKFIKKNPTKTQQQHKKSSEEVLFCGELILKHLGLLIYFFQLFVILHGLKYITKLFLVPLVPDQDYYSKFTPVKKSSLSITEAVTPQMSESAAQDDLHSL